MRTAPGHRAEDPFDHHALYYGRGQAYREGVMPFIEGGLADGEPVAVAVPGPDPGLIFKLVRW